jgi:hypothetical protein
MMTTVILAVHGFIFSWAFLPLIDAGERRAPLEYSPIGRSTLVAGINASYVALAPVRDLLLSAKHLFVEAIRGQLPPAGRVKDAYLGASCE